MVVYLKILLWKNFKSEARMLPQTFGEILAIIVLSVFIIANPSKSPQDFSPSETQRTTLKIFAEDSLSGLQILQKYYEDGDFPYNLAYSPDIAFAKSIAEGVAERLGLKATTTYLPNKNLAELIFPLSEGDDTPRNLTVHIRFPGAFRTYKSNRVHSNLWLSRCTGCLTTSLDDRFHELQTDLYIREGFLQLQHAVFMEWYSKLGGTEGPSVVVRSFRYDTKERLCQSLQTPNVISLLYYFMFFLPFCNLIWKYGRETEENMLAHHWRYGCNSLKYWWAHFSCSFLHFFILGLMVYILTIISWRTRIQPEYFDQLAFLYLLIIIILSTCELIISAMVIVSLVQSAVNAIYFGILLWVLMYAVFSIVLEYSVNLKSYWMILCLVIMFNNDFVYGVRYLMKLDRPASENIGNLVAIMLGSILLKLIFLALVQYFKPGQYVQRGPFHYFGLRALCSSRQQSRCKNTKSRIEMQEQIMSREHNQFGPLYSERYVIVWQVEKSFKNFREPVRYVLKKINMIFFGGEITVVLGHYSSGKTTFASLLAGWQRPKNGIIDIADKNLHCEKGALEMADVCMPNNALFDELTTSETLTYFCNIKGHFRRQELFNEEVLLWLRTLKPIIRQGDEHKLLVRDMTFDQKRLLSLCCCLCCGTKVIILDEPTAHMRAAEQRLYWSILQREKADRSIIVMTNSFREAQVISDRIAVFTDGTLKAYGTSMFLNSMFGSGFNLIVIKSEDVPSQPITGFLTALVPDIELSTETSAHLVYTIPSDKRNLFQMLLIQLEKRFKEFGIVEARIVTSELNEVYLSLGKIREQAEIPETPQALSVDFLPKKKRIAQQWSAVFFKKFKHQPSTVIPLFMCLASILLITLLAQSLDVLHDRENAANSIVLGFDDNHDRKLLNRMNTNCKFIGIQKVKIGSTLSRDRSHSFTFIPDSFYCGQKRFLDYVTGSFNGMGHMYGAVEVAEDGKYTVYVNQHILHSAPLALNLFHNYILETSAFQSDNNVVARVVNDPIPIPAPHATGLLNSQIDHLFLPLAIGIILPITLCTFIFPVVEERKSNALMLMSIAGLRIDIYWFVNFIWDWLTFFIYSVFFQLVIIISYYPEIRLADTFFIFFVINIYSIPVLISLYFLSMLTQSSKKQAYAIACLIHVTTGLFAFVVFWDVLLAQPWYLYVFLLLPTFAMLDGISNVYVLSRFLKKCTQLCNNLDNCDLRNVCETVTECCDYSFFDWGNSGILRSTFFLIFSAIILILLMFWVEIHKRESKFLVTTKIRKMFTKTYPYDDPTIIAMRERIATEDLRTIGKKRLVVDQVERKIPRNSMALSTISFDVEKKFCLGIFGTNRVGKTHLCRQIIGQDGFQFGDIYVRGIPVKYNVDDAWVYLGYAPQNLCVLTGFTVDEILNFFCLIRGVPKGATPTVVSEILSLFGLEKVKNRKIHLLGKGTQRKITIALAFVATNKVIILDEPTRGLPQWACREIWNAVRYLCNCGKTIVFTTDNMHECDAIADTVLIIDEKDMLAYGSSQKLRSKHIGFYLEIRLRRDGSSTEEVEENLRIDVDNLHRFMIFMHSESILVHRIDNCLKFYIPVQKINFNYLYGSLEKNRVRLNIAEYTVSQGSFEEVLKHIAAKRDQAATK